jgi:hypothetical protein
VFRFVFLVLHTPTKDGEAAQERFSEGTLTGETQPLQTSQT